MHLVFVNVPSLQRELDLYNIVKGSRMFASPGLAFYQSRFITVTMAIFLYFKYVFYIDRLVRVIVLYECIS